MAGENSVRHAPRQRRRVLLGTLILAALVGVATLIFFLDDLIGALRTEYAIHAVVPGAPGLVVGSPVWLDGRETGVVSAVGVLSAVDDTVPRVLVRITLPVGVRSQIRTDSEVRLTSVNVMSERAVDITSGSAAAPVLPDGDTLYGSRRPTAVELTARTRRVRAELNAVLGELRSYAPAVRTRLAQTERAFQRLGLAADEAGQIQAAMAANPGMRLLREPAFTAALDSVRLHADELGALVTTLSERTAATGEVRTALARLQLRSDSLRVQLAAATRALENPNGTLARMQQDSALVHAIAAARAELDSLIADVRRNPLRYVF